MIINVLSIPASDDFFLDGASSGRVHDEGRDEATQVEAPIE